jgi:ppGpp synthetase/RelA/SpoT-type nucleotidyltranferase
MPDSLQFPDLGEALYQAHSLLDASQLYVEMLRETDNIINFQYAAKLEQCAKMLSAKHLNELETLVRSFKEHMRNWSKQHHVRLILKGRQKSFLSLNSKIRLFLSKGDNLSKIHDLIGFRIVVETDNHDTEDTICACYQVLNETISFFMKEKDCMLLEAEPVTSQMISPEDAKRLGIVIPEKSLVIPGFENNIKDYVVHPKSRGYQSLHFLVLTPQGFIFEVQLRTTAMDIIAEYGPAKHDNHKDERYGNLAEQVLLDSIDITRIHMPGFLAIPDGQLFDQIGLIKSINPLEQIH